MGQQAIDEFSYLHLATGIIFRFFELGIFSSLVIHTAFEILENTMKGVRFINTYLTMWPGGKTEPDSVMNSVFDTVFFAAGWVLADQIIKAYRRS